MRATFGATLVGKKGTPSSTATMARRRAKDDNEGLTEEEQRWKLLDYFPTPPWAARAGAELALTLWDPQSVVREPAAGGGHLAGPLREYFPEVYESDLFPHRPGIEVRDWMDEFAWGSEADCDVIMTNPPFGIAEEFVTRGLRRARRGVGLLLRTVYVESISRYPLFENDQYPLTLFAPFSERVPMTLGKWDPEASSATSYAWFFWSKDSDPMPPRWIKPGSCARLSRPDDEAKYGWRAPAGAMPLFEVGDVI